MAPHEHADDSEPTTTTATDTTRTIAVVGSFRQHLGEVRVALEAFLAAGWNVTSPPGGDVLQPDIEFVRFKADDVAHDDETVQTIAMHRILRADAVYVVSPGGYVGRTTCYEIGRVIQTNSRLYFSEAPHDLPIRVPSEVIVTAGQLAAQPLESLLTASQWPDPDGSGWDRALINQDYLDL